MSRVKYFLGSFTLVWEQRKVTELGKIYIGLVTTMTKHYTDEGTLLIRNSDIKDGRFEFGSDPIYLETSFAEENASRMHKLGDVITVHTGDVGTSAVITENEANSIGFATIVTRPNQEIICSEYLCTFLNTEKHKRWAIAISTGDGRTNYNLGDYFELIVPIPDLEEQKRISLFVKEINHLITLHQRKPFYIKYQEEKMENKKENTELFCDYYAKWISVYKEGAIREVTLDKYKMTQKWLRKLVPDLKMCDLNRISYQQLLNDYATTHERQTTMDFHHQLKGAILDAVDEGLIERDPTRKAIIKGKTPSENKKIKYLNQFELHTLISNLNLTSEITWDWFILLIAKTGLRFSEALALTPKDFDFAHQSISVNKTWNYKGGGGFLPTKNKSSVRKVQIDWQMVIQFSELIKKLPEDEPVFVKDKVYNSTVNDILSRHCKKANIPVISIHGLRHTHASILLFAGVSIASVARRLGHSSMNTTQKTYLHIIQELENRDIDLVMRSLSVLN